jgi:hypothetical protein
MKRQSLLHWYPVLLRYGGLTGCLVFVPAVWLVTNRLEPALIAMFMSMVGIGEGVDALRDFTHHRPPEGPPLPKKALPSEGDSS